MTALLLGFLGGSEGKASACNARYLGLIPGSGTSPEKEMATHSGTLAWKIPWTEKPGRLQSMGSQRVSWTAERIHFLSFITESFPYGSASQESTYNEGDLGSITELGRFPGEGKGYPFQYSGLENSMD